MKRRVVCEPGGVLIIGCGLVAGELADKTQHFYDQAASLTVLIDAAQQKSSFMADEVWCLDRLGLRGFFALIRRISWRRFDVIIDVSPQGMKWLTRLIWPRPSIYRFVDGADLPVDLQKI